jgi:hypothetical protein
MSVNPPEALARAACREAGVDEDFWWSRLNGETAEELANDANELAALERERVYRRDHPPDQATLDREAAENEARIAEIVDQVAANKAEIDQLSARVAEIRREEGGRNAQFNAQIAKLDARAAALRAEIRGRLAARGTLGSPRETRPRRSRAGAGSAASRDGPSDEPPLDGRGSRLRPELIVRVPLEGTAVVELHAESFEDQQRLLRWLLASDAVLDLSVDVLRVVADLLGEEGGAE